MPTATLSRGGTTVDIPLVEEGGTPVVNVDHGKPHLSVHESGILNPRVQDSWSGLRSYTITGLFHDSANAYSDAIALADLVKSYSGGNPITLNIDMPEYDTDIETVPQAEQERALSLSYPPGVRDLVEVQLGLTRVSSVEGSGTMDASTPTATGSGPIQLTDGSTTVDLSNDVTVERTIGRPNSSLERSTSQDPFYVDHLKSAYDAFSIGFEFVDNVQSQVTDIASLLDQRLGRGALTLKFNGVFGLGSFDVVGQGSSALRHTRTTGEAGTSQVPTLELRVVTAG